LVKPKDFEFEIKTYSSLNENQKLVDSDLDLIEIPDEYKNKKLMIENDSNHKSKHHIYGFKILDEEFHFFFSIGNIVF
jgi:hypothetical protein